MNNEFRDQGVVICKCNHLSTFGVLVVRQIFESVYSKFIIILF